MPTRILYSKISKDYSSQKRYLLNLKYPSIPPREDDIYIITTSEDRLDLLANSFYNDSDLWWIIAIANPNKIKGDSIRLKSNLQIRIPQDSQLILHRFEQINK